MNGPRVWSTRPLRELGCLAALLASWLVPWLMLTGAAAIAGGHPSASPLTVVTPAFLGRLLAHWQVGAWWLLVGPSRAVAPVIFWASLVVEGAVVAAAGVAGSMVVRYRRGPVLRATRWARARDMRGLRCHREPPGRILLGRHAGALIGAERETSVLVVGPTRSGKTTALVVPNLLAWNGPAVVTSTKSELLRITAGARQRLGPVYAYDPTGDASDFITSTPWSPLSGCTDLDHSWRTATWLSAGLQPIGNARGDNDWAHWAESAKLLLAPMLYAASCTNRTLLDVHAWILSFDVATAFGVLEEQQYDGDPQAARALLMLQAIDQRPERERGTVFSTVARVFSAFNEGAVADSARVSRFDPQRLLADRGTLYLCSARQSPERVAGLFVAVLMSVVTTAYAQAERSSAGRLKPPLGLFLDELANVVPVDDLPSLASQGAGRGIVLLSIVQDLSQLRARYGPDRTNSIVNNHVAKLVLPGITDVETTDLFTRLAGQRFFTEQQVNVGATGGASRTYQVRAEPILPADGMRQLPSRRAALLYRGRPPAVIRLRPWYASRRLTALARTPFIRNAESVVSAT